MEPLAFPHAGCPWPRRIDLSGDPDGGPGGYFEFLALRDPVLVAQSGVDARRLQLLEVPAWLTTSL